MWVPFYLPFSNCTKILELFLFTMQIKVRARAHHHIFTYLDHDGKQYGQGRNQSISWHCKAPYCPNFERRILTILFMSSYFQDSNGWDAKRLCATFLITQKISRPFILLRSTHGCIWEPLEGWSTAFQLRTGSWYRIGTTVKWRLYSRSSLSWLVRLNGDFIIVSVCLNSDGVAAQSALMISLDDGDHFGKEV